MLRRAALLLLACPAALPAQGVVGPEASLELTSDQRRRGLSWSDGAAAVEATVYVPLSPALALTAGASSLRGSARHRGADLGVDLGAQAALDRGNWRVTGELLGHLFPGRGGLAYAEGQARVAYLLGPAEVGLRAAYAPRQTAIGGDNLYVSARALLGLPGTPVTLSGQIGRSSGDSNGDVRSRRLRPDGPYTDWRIGAEWVRAPITLGVSYVDASIDRTARTGAFRDRHVGARLLANARLSF